MSFTNDNIETISFAMTNYGKWILSKNGMDGLQLYCTLIDNQTVYSLDVYPILGIDFKGESDGLVNNQIIFNSKYKLI